MGERGPAPIPYEILSKRGSHHARGPRVAKAPRPEPGIPSCPGWMTKGAKAAWRMLAKMLLPMGVATKADRNSMTRYCVLWDRWRKVEDAIVVKGQTFEGKEGPKIRPEVKIAAQLAEQLARMEREFGLTPSARTRIMVHGNSSSKKEEGELAARKRGMLA